MSKEYQIGDIIRRIKRPVSLVNDQVYKLVTIKMNHKGVVLREVKLGALIKSGMYLVKAGDFILSGIDARNGAFGIVPEDLDGAIVTNDFWFFEINEEIISKDLFLELTATTWFDEICKRGSDGTTQRIRLQKDKFFNQPILLPGMDEQKELLSKIHLIKDKQAALVSEIQSQKRLISKLKQSILQKAFQGMITEEWRVHRQNEGIETELASELVKRIQVEKARLIKENKIKKEKPMKPISEEEKPFKLPEGWGWCRLGEISDSIIGLVYKPSDISEIGTPVLRANNVFDGKIVLDNLVKVTCKIPTNKIADQGDILVCVRSGSKNLIGKAAIINQEGFSFGAFMSLLKPKIDCNYLYYFLQSEIFKIQIDDEKSTGINQLTQSILRNIVLPIPSIMEQKAIVEKVKFLMDKCRGLEEEINKSGQQSRMLMQAVLKEAFEYQMEVDI